MLPRNFTEHGIGNTAGIQRTGPGVTCVDPFQVLRSASGLPVASGSSGSRSRGSLHWQRGPRWGLRRQSQGAAGNPEATGRVKRANSVAVTLSACLERNLEERDGGDGARARARSAHAARVPPPRHHFVTPCGVGRPTRVGLHLAEALDHVFVPHCDIPTD